VHPRWGTPYVATTVVFGMCCIGLLLPSNLIFLFLAVNIPILLKYGATCLSAVRVANRHPEIRANAGIPLQKRTVLAWAMAGIVCAVLVILLGLQADWRPYAVLSTWAIVGLVYYLVRGSRFSTEDNGAGGDIPRAGSESKP